MRSMLLSCLLALTLGTQAQTYYYINNIGVSPAAPTTADPVTITLFGDLSASNSYIVSASSNLVGNQVQLTVVAASQGIGLPVLVPHDESFSLGTLAAGTYTITITGAGIGDFAPAPEHQFTVTGGGGSPCDSLALSPLTWHPFTDTLLVLTAANSSSTLFDYPGFVLLDTQGDTLAQEVVNYFGIGQGPQAHLLAVQPGATVPTGSFAGDLELWTLFYQSLGCTWNGTFDLCPPVPCAPLQVWIGNTGGALVQASFDYTVTDGNGTTMASGTLTLDTLEQFAYGGLCLPPGDYTLAMVQPLPVGGALSYGLETTAVAGPQEVFVQGGATNELPFAYYPACFSGSNGISESLTASEFDVRLAHGNLVVMTRNGDAVGAISVLDAQGRSVKSVSGTSSTISLDISTVPPGLLLVQRTTSEGRRSVARVMNIR